MRYKWGDLISLEYGKPVKDKSLLDGPVPVYGTNGKIGTSNLPPLCQNASFVLGRKGAYRGVHYSNIPFSVIDTAFYAKNLVPKRLSLKWAYYMFLTYDINSMDSGSAIPSTDRYEIYAVEVDLPPLGEQLKSVHLLETFDNKIELNQQINGNLQQQAQAIYASRFTDTDGRLADICRFSKEKTFVSQLTLDSYYSTENMLPEKRGSVQAANLPTTAQTTRCSSGDVLVSNIRPYFKKIVYCLSDGGCSTDVLCFTPKGKKLSAYLFYTLYADKFFDHMVAGSKGTKMPRGDKQQIMTYPIHVPSDAELADYNSIAQPILTKVEKNREENLHLTALRDTLLPKLLSGEIDVGSVSI